MDQHLQLIADLARPAKTRIVLLVIDGVGDLVTAEQPQTALERASTPHLDALARRSAVGRQVPVAQAVTTGSGPGHLALFGYDPLSEEADIGRGVLEALGVGMEIGPGDVAARGNFATADADGNLTDRRAGRIPTEECRRLVALLNRALEATPVPGLDAHLEAGEAYRCVLRLSGHGLNADLGETDPQRLGVPPLRLRAQSPSAAATAEKVRRLIKVMEAAIADEPRANRLLLRGFSGLPRLPQMDVLYHLRAGCFAGYPLYRGVASACGMTVVDCGKTFDDVLAKVRDHWDDFDFFFLHVKDTDKAGEDGDLEAKVEAIEMVDRLLPDLFALEPDVICVTGDHSTPAPHAAHSWHPVPVLMSSQRCFVDDVEEFGERAAIRGHLGTVQGRELLGLMLANAGRLSKFGA